MYMLSIFLGNKSVCLSVSLCLISILMLPISWMPDRVVTDFEVAAMNAIRAELPAVRVNGCYFHFTQSLWRKIQELGLSG